MLNLKIRYILLGLTSSLMLGCESNNIGSSPQNVNNKTAITIDSASTIPVFDNKPTSTIIYVHNNSVTDITEINYSNVNNVGEVDGSECGTISAGQSCELKIATPKLSDHQTQGSMFIKANYKLSGENHSFSQVINYASLDSDSNKIANGIKVKSGATIYAYRNTSGFTTLYLYGSGINQDYTLTDLTINQSYFKVAKSNIGLTISANTVQAMEISAPTSVLPISANISIQSKLVQGSQIQNQSTKNLLAEQQIMNSVGVSVEPISAGAILISSLVPLINTGDGSNVSSITFLNAGNQDALTGQANATNGLHGLSSDCDNQTLSPGSSCMIYFQFTESGGSGSITLPYEGGTSSSAAGDITWFNGRGAPLVSVSIANNPLSVPSGGVSDIITLTNVGGYTLHNMNIPTPSVITGNATVENVFLSEGIVCEPGMELTIGSSCEYFISVNDETNETGQINLEFSVDYDGVDGTSIYKRFTPLTYISDLSPP
jgi:hypothetical protein